MTNLKVQKSVPLSELTTFKIGGKAEYFVEVKNDKELQEAASFAKKNRLEVFVLGGGSDVLVSDDLYQGLVIKFVGDNMEITKKTSKYALVSSQAGAVWDDLVAFSVEKGLRGIECLSAIPGTVGAAPIQNIGAYGQELKDTFVKLTAYDFKADKFVEFSKRKCQFDYRESVFKKKRAKGRYLITNLTLKLTAGGRPDVTYQSLVSFLREKGLGSNPSLSEIRDAVTELRWRVLEDPKITGNAGSFFKNPIVSAEFLGSLKNSYPNIPSYPVGVDKVKLFAGWLVEKAGWKGKTYKNAKVSDKHALVITNHSGKASAKEVKQLAEKISTDVYKKFGVRLEPEVQFINF